MKATAQVAKEIAELNGKVFSLAIECLDSLKYLVGTLPNESITFKSDDADEILTLKLCDDYRCLEFLGIIQGLYLTTDNKLHLTYKVLSGEFESDEKYSMTCNLITVGNKGIIELTQYVIDEIEAQGFRI